MKSRRAAGRLNDPSGVSIAARCAPLGSLKNLDLLEPGRQLRTSRPTRRGLNPIWYEGQSQKWPNAAALLGIGAAVQDCGGTPTSSFPGVTICLPHKPFLTNAQMVRVSKRLTLDQVAAAAWMHSADVSRVERGIKPPTPIQRQRIATALNIEPDELVKEPTL